MAAIYFTTFNIRAQTTTFTATTLRADTIKSTQIIKADAITAADTLKAQSHVVAKQNLEVQGNLFVNGAATFNTKILSPNGFLFDSINGLRTAVLTTGSVTTNIFSIGKQIGTTNPFPTLPCSTPVNTQWFLNNGGGFASQQNNPVSNPNVNALVKLYTAQWNGSGYMEVEGVDQNAQPNNALFINYFCGRNVSICENTSLAGGGGRVQVGNFFSAKKHVEIGDATYGISDTSNIALGINANAGKGIVLKTWNNGFPLISISNTNFPKSPFTLYGNGQTFIGVKKPNPTGPHANAMLSVDGKILAKEIYVNINTATWADYVFDKSYKLLELNEVEKYIIENKHLPNIPSEKELIKEGSLDINVAEMQKLQMQKIEELFLYVIDLKKEIELLKKENTNLKAKTK